MLLIFSNLSPKTSKDDFLSFSLSFNDKWLCVPSRKKYLFFELIDLMDQKTGERERYALARYSDYADAMEAKSRLDGRILDGKEIKVLALEPCNSKCVQENYGQEERVQQNKCFNIEHRIFDMVSNMNIYRIC
jgi:hypothetical protein